MKREERQFDCLLHKQIYINFIQKKEKKRKMDETTFQMYDRIVSTLFNDGVVNFGTILTLRVYKETL